MPRVQDLIIISISSIYFLLVYLTLWSIRDVLDASGNERHWTLGLFINLLGYAAIFVPGILILNFVKKSNYLEGRPHNFLRPLIQLCFFGSEETIQDSIAKDEARNNANLVFCFFGLQVSYLTMGILQEKIMTKTYEDSAGHVGRYKDSQFLVFVNRVLAFAVAFTYIVVSHQPRHHAPIFKYSFTSFSNIMSSWCQYEALKFVSFPTQVLTKSFKVIPVMIMGKLLSNKKYELAEYVMAILTTIGMIGFFHGSEDMPNTSQKSATITISGFLLLFGYLICDSFTLTWQNKITRVMLSVIFK